MEAWSFPDEEEFFDEPEMISSAEFDFWDDAAKWAMERMDEGFQTRMYKR